VCQHHADDLGVHDRDPREAPVLLANGKRWRSPKATINLIDDGLHYGSDGIVLMRLWPPYDGFDHH
jgi:hypothetical protein